MADNDDRKWETDKNGRRYEVDPVTGKRKQLHFAGTKYHTALSTYEGVRRELARTIRGLKKGINCPKCGGSTDLPPNKAQAIIVGCRALMEAIAKGAQEEKIRSLEETVLKLRERLIASEHRRENEEN